MNALPVRSLAEMRRMIRIPGMTIESIAHWQAKLLGTRRTVEKPQTNGFFYRMNGERMWCPFPKAEELAFNEDGTVTFHPGSERSWTFRFLEVDSNESTLIEGGEE